MSRRGLGLPRRLDAPAGESLVQPMSNHALGHVISLSDRHAALSDATAGEQRRRMDPASWPVARCDGDTTRLSITAAEHGRCWALALLGHVVPSGDPAVVYAGP